MRLSLIDTLPFVTIVVAYRGRKIRVRNVLVDTGSATTIFAVDMMESIHLVPAPDDVIHIVRGVGGGEAVFSRVVDYVQIGDCPLSDFEIEVGGMDYGFEINDILGMDFLIRAGAIINLREQQIEFA